MKNFLIALLLPVVLFISCDEIEDPAQEVGPPSINVDFVAEGTLEKVDAEFEELDSIVDAYQVNYDTLTEKGYYEDTMAVGILLRERSVILDSISALRSLFNGGRVRLDTFAPLNSNKRLITDTTNSSFDLPLNVFSDSSSFAFSYHNIKDTITFAYKTRRQAGLDKIVIVAYDVRLVYSSFDNISRLYCNNENCTSNEVVFEVFF